METKKKSKKKETVAAAPIGTTTTADVAPMPARLGLPLQRRAQPHKFCDCENEACLCDAGKCKCSKE